MAITYPRDLPNLDDIISIVYRQKTTVGMFPCMFSGIIKTQAHPGQYWELEAQLRPLNRADADEWWAWLVSLNGREKKFLAPLQIPNRMKGLAVNYTAPTLIGAHVRGATSLNILGQSFTDNYLRYGDFVQLGSGSDARLHMVLENVDTGLTGQAVFDIWPMLRTDYSDSTTVTVSNPLGVFRLAENMQEIMQDPSNTRKGLKRKFAFH